MSARSWWIAAVPVAYLPMTKLLAHMTIERGLLTPRAGIDVALLIVTVLVLLLRLVTLFVLPALIVHRLFARTFTRRAL